MLNIQALNQLITKTGLSIVMGFQKILIMMMMTGNLSILFTITKVKSKILRKFLKFKPNEKRELSRKVRFNLFLMNLEDSLNLKAGFAILIIIGFSFSTEYFGAEYGLNFKIPIHIKITLVVCLLLSFFVAKLSAKNFHSFVLSLYFLEGVLTYSQIVPNVKIREFQNL